MNESHRVLSQGRPSQNTEEASVVAQERSESAEGAGQKKTKRKGLSVPQRRFLEKMESGKEYRFNQLPFSEKGNGHATFKALKKKGEIIEIKLTNDPHDLLMAVIYGVDVSIFKKK